MFLYNGGFDGEWEIGLLWVGIIKLVIMKFEVELGVFFWRYKYKYMKCFVLYKFVYV